MSHRTQDDSTIASIRVGPSAHAEPQAAASEEALLPGIAGDDTTALSVAFERTAGLIYANVLRILGEPRLCDEVTQEVFRDASGAVGAFDVTGNDVRHWLLDIAHRRATERLSGSGTSASRLLDQRVDPRAHPVDPLAHPIGAPGTSSGRAFPGMAHTEGEAP